MKDEISFVPHPPLNGSDDQTPVCGCISIVGRVAAAGACVVLVVRERVDETTLDQCDAHKRRRNSPQSEIHPPFRSVSHFGANMQQG